METKKIDSVLEIEMAIEKISLFLENLKNIYVFDYVNIICLTPLDITIEYLLKGKEKVDSIDIWILEKEKCRVILIQGEKKFSVEYFFLELEKIL